MNVQNLLEQFVGQPAQESRRSNISGIAGGAAAGGVMALLVGNKKARKFAGKAATYGGAAVLGGVAFAAMRNWQQKQTPHKINQPKPSEPMTAGFELTLIKTMISAANADGHIDEDEHSRLLAAMEELNVEELSKRVFMDLIRYPETPENIAREVVSLEQRSEVYLMACFSIDIDTAEERAYLNRLATALKLPDDLTQQLELQAQELVLKAA